jgi:hypothetical protein
MAGVEILATQDVATAFTFNWIECFIVFGIAFGLFVIGGIIASWIHDDISMLGAMFIAGIIFGVLFGAVVGFFDGTPIEYETQYKVTISDEVPMNDFLEKYEILDQEGKIYTVRERGVEDGK